MAQAIQGRPVMVIEFIRPWAHYSPGQRIDAPGGQAELMIQRGICKKADEPKPQEKKQAVKK